MKFLLDTHAFLWFINGDSQLSGYARQQIENLENKRLISTASIWEMAIKVSIGKLKLGLPFTEIYNEHIRGNAIELLEIAPDHLDILKSLFFHHKDPFDRLIISQSIAENIPVLSQDAVFDEYKAVRRLW